MDKYLQKARKARKVRNCEKKKVYQTQTEANTAAEIRNQTAYQCDICSLFHLTHKPWGVKKRIQS